MIPVVGVLALTLATQAGPTPPGAAVEGVVRDADSGEPLAGAVVVLADLDRAVRTGADGRYALAAVPPGPQHLVVRQLGYATRTLHLLVPGAGRIEFNVSLLPSPIRLDGVTVSPSRPLRGLDPADSTAFPERGITRAGLRNHPTLAQADPLQALVGGEVLAWPEAPTGIHVRGGASHHTGYVLDGVPVLSPYHAAGLFSAWNPDALAGLRMAAAAPSPALPDALSGSIVASTREPGPGLRVQSAISNTEARATVDGPVPAGASYLLAWRSGLSGSVVPGDEASYLAGETADFVGTLRVAAAGGQLRLLLYDAENELGATSALPEGGDPGGTVPRNTFDWTSRSVGVSWVRERSSSTTVRVGAWRAAADAGSSWHGDPGTSILAADRTDYGLGASVEHRSSRSTTEAGIRLRSMETGYRVRGEGSADSWSVGGSTRVLTAFAQRSRELGSSVDAWAGVSGSMIGGRIRLAPRARLRWRSGDLMMTTAYSRMIQFAQSLRNAESVVGHVFPADLFLGSGVAGVPVPRSDQWVLAAELRASAGVRLGAQAFTRRLDDLVLVAPTEPGPFATTAFTIGSATARGASIELAARGARYGLVASYGLQRVRVSAGDLVYSPRHGTTHRVDAGIVVFPGPTSSVRLAVAGASGRTATTMSGPFEWETCNVVDRGCEFAGSPELLGSLGGDRLPAYARLDIGARKHWHTTVRGRDVLFGVFGTVTNVLGRYNTLVYSVDPDTGERQSVEMLPRTPLVIGIDTRF